MAEVDTGLIGHIDNRVQDFKNLLLYREKNFETEEQKSFYDAHRLNLVHGYLLLFTCGCIGAHRIYAKNYKFLWPFFMFFFPDAVIVFCIIDIFWLPAALYFYNLKLKKLIIDSPQSSINDRKFINFFSFDWAGYLLAMYYFVNCFTYLTSKKIYLFGLWDLYLNLLPPIIFPN